MAIAVLNGDDVAVARWYSAPEVLLPRPALAKLLYGAYRSARRSENTQRVWSLVASMGLCSCDHNVCERVAEIKLALAEAGRPIPTNDLWIAAYCLSAEATLASRDAHFDVVPGLAREAW